VRKGGKVVIAGDGQVSLGATVIKANAKKVRSLGKGDVIGGFAASTRATSSSTTRRQRLRSLRSTRRVVRTCRSGAAS
jgi:ATP-dependent HslUV protease subunit HslV